MTGLAHPSAVALLAAIQAYARDQAPDIAAFCGPDLFADLPTVAVQPSSLVGVETMMANPPEATEATQPVRDAFLAASDHMHWQQSYTLDDPGIDQHYLDNSGWFNLVSPDGIFVSDQLRVMAGFWGQGLHYPDHNHAPEEIYLCVAGSALFISEGRASVQGGPGTTICHYAHQRHSADTDAETLIALAFWRGGPLTTPPRLG